MGKRKTDRSCYAERSKKVAKCEKSEDEESCVSALNDDPLVGTILEDINKKKWRIGKPIGEFGVFFAKIAKFTAQRDENA